MQPVEPISTINLFPELHAQLIYLLKELTEEEWQQPTVCSPWTVKDIVAHLLDGDIKRLSAQRDQFSLPPAEPPLSGYDDLVGFINQNNYDWVKAASRISPRLLVEFLELTGWQVYKFFKTLDPNQPAIVSVAWAGDEVSPNWFDIAREYTERWLHQQQIRDALRRPGLNQPHQLRLVLDTFVRALPYTYRAVDAADGVSLSVSISGAAGGDWTLLREQGQWCLFSGSSPEANAHISLDQDTAWRLFTKGLSPDKARRRMQFEGDKTLGAAILHMVSIMA